MEEHYIHGYSAEEQQRLISQNEVLASYIYREWDFGQLQHLVEVGCGVGAQMMVLLDSYPALQLTGIEQSAQQIRRAQVNLSHFPDFEGRYELLEGDASTITPAWDVPPDAVLLVWVLEHVPDPVRLLRQVRRWMPSGCRLYITEVFHDSFATWPIIQDIRDYWQDTLRCQRRLGGDPNVGLRLASILEEAGYKTIKTQAHTFLLDASKPEERSRLLDYWLNLMRSALHQSLSTGDTTLQRWQMAEASMKELMRMADATFYYSFIQAEGLA
jgi:ubiquinone/menaquinone biosynthesis C-methylase UbiE